MLVYFLELVTDFWRKRIQRRVMWEWYKLFSVKRAFYDIPKWNLFTRGKMTDIIKIDKVALLTHTHITV